MPFTPFHFGPGAAIKVIWPRAFSFLTFAAAQVVTDLEPGYFILQRQPPLHRWAHTYLGAVVVAAVTALLMGLILRVWQKTVLRLRARSVNAVVGPKLYWRVILISAFVGTVSHVFLDSIMHPDMHPFAPFSVRNPMLGLISLKALHYSCIGSGVFALVYGLLRGSHAAFAGSHRKSVDPASSNELNRPTS
jgi:hypothetical protein